MLQDGDLASTDAAAEAMSSTIPFEYSGERTGTTHPEPDMTAYHNRIIAFGPPFRRSLPIGDGCVQ
jgi:hypothetical protein